MNTVFYLFIPRGDGAAAILATETLNWVYKDVKNELKSGEGSLADAVSAAREYQVTVVLPGENVSFLSAKVAGKNIQRIQQAVPYVLEDSLIDDVDELHFAIKKSGENKYDVAVVNKSYLASIINQVRKAGIQPNIVTADYLLLTDKNTLYTDGERVLFNSSELKFSLIAGGEISLADSLADMETVNVIQCGKQQIKLLDKLIESEKVNKEVCAAHPLICLVKNSSATSGINLLQGEFKKKKKWPEVEKTWLPVAALFLLWLGVQGVLFVVDYVGLSNQSQTLMLEVNKIYKQTFPESKRIVNAKVQMQQKLTSLQKHKGQSGRSFTQMLSGSASVFSKTKNLKIKSLRYYDGRMNLEIQIASLQALEQLKNQLNKEKGYQVEVQNASSGKETVTAQLQITGAVL